MAGESTTYTYAVTLSSGVYHISVTTNIGVEAVSTTQPNPSTLANGTTGTLTSGSQLYLLTGTYHGAATYVGAVESNGTVIGFVINSNGRYLFLTNDPSPPTVGEVLAVDPNTSWDMASPPVYCFLAGTHIRTPSGDREIESLRTGDLVRLEDGSSTPVRWIGRNTVHTRFADPLRVMPIRIKAGALGDGLPERDLLVSPDHAMLVDDILIQAGALINHSSISQETHAPETFVYYHVEVANHTLIFAEGCLAETFIDNVNRMGFDNWGEHEALYSDVEMQELHYPRAKSQRQIPVDIQKRLSIRAQTLFQDSASAAA